MVFGWFDSTLSTKYLLTKTEKLMRNNMLPYQEYVIKKKEVQKEEAKEEYSVIAGFILFSAVICMFVFL